MIDTTHSMKTMVVTV